MSSTTSILSKKVNPISLAALAFGGVILFGLLGRLSFSSDMSQRFPWMVGAAFCMVFTIFNCVLLISTPNLPRYLSQSVAAYVVLALGSAGFAYLLTGVHPREVGSIIPIFLVLTIGYTVLLGIVGTIKFLIGFFNEEEQKKLLEKKPPKRRWDRKK